MDGSSIEEKYRKWRGHWILRRYYDEGNIMYPYYEKGQRHYMYSIVSWLNDDDCWNTNYYERTFNVDINYYYYNDPIEWRKKRKKKTAIKY